ncbi:peptide chain release factor-like protein [Akkermansiaceae bacterium]|nr:peptide chain release factor-like protein [Akkermansiaceae bacterium]MDA7935817.1 peptide chain release factor-like protein [bacterium]MDB4421403.1 peptide chain release factor-like protein [Akkermansiaceae bacterium]MDB4462156.1 peptide chain release factor-like protein [bacterium]MDB4462565.1 peptide chain release factor-like protein [Akkermansiaceae bacterium]
MISADRKAALNDRMVKLGILEDDLIEKFVRGTGSGGQKMNKTSSCVFLQHPPTGLETKVQRDRSREMNRYLARKELCDQLEEITLGKQSARQQAREKIRRSKGRQSRRQRAKTVVNKRIHGQKKQNRQRPSSGD